MSIFNSHFSKNNTLISNSSVNTGRNPVTELFFGNLVTSQYPSGYSRFIFDLDLTTLKSMVSDGTIVTGSCQNSNKHILRMTNTTTFDNELTNTSTSQGRQRATSFDLVLFRIPFIDNDPSQPQLWDEGVGYDFADLKYNIEIDRNYSNRPSNWTERTTLDNWQVPGLYDNDNTGITPYSALTIIDTQHFQFGNENISLDMTNEINSILDGSLTNVTGWGIAFKPQLEQLTGITDIYEVQFFTRHTQTFYEPFLETTYDDLIDDDRNLFSLGKTNKLYLYLYENGNPINLDENPIVNILDASGDLIVGLSGLTTCRRTKGVYEVTVPPLLGYKTPCMFTDQWTNLKINGVSLNNIDNEFILQPFKNVYQIGTNSSEPKLYGFDYYGIKQDEKIFNTDIRKVGVIIKQAFTTNKLLQKVGAYYRVYVKEGQTEVQVQDWTKINRTPNEYYFLFDTRDKIPNEYFIDLKVESSGEVSTYKKQIKFQIVNYK